MENTFYSPYGEILEGGKSSRFGYENKEYDSLVEDIDFKFRKYNPKVPPIFNQPDTLIQNVYDPQSLNRYAFERNNPYKYTDPTGHNILQYISQACFSSTWCSQALFYTQTAIRNFISNPQSLSRAAYKIFGSTAFSDEVGTYQDSLSGTYLPPEAIQSIGDVCIMEGSKCINAHNKPKSHDFVPEINDLNIIIQSDSLKNIQPPKSLGSENLPKYSYLLLISGVKTEIDLKNGGTSGSFTCNADYCSVFPGTKAERDKARKEKYEKKREGGTSNDKNKK